MEHQNETSSGGVVPASDRRIALVTGANQGIGLQIAKDLVASGFAVLVGSRNLERGEVAAKEIGQDAYALPLDVKDETSISNATEYVRNKFGRLDVLVNNAAISNTRKTPGMSLEEYAKIFRPSNMLLDEVCEIWETNVFGVVAVTRAMLPFLREAPAACIVNVSSSACSMTMNSNLDNPFRQMFSLGYSVSKMALNGITLAFVELEPEGIEVNAVSPGFNKTSLNSYAGTDTIVEGAREAIRVAVLGADGPTGTFRMQHPDR